MFFKTGVLKNFAVSTWKHLCWNLFSIKFQAWHPATLLERDSNAGVSCEYCGIFKILKTFSSFLYRTLWWLLLFCQYLEKPGTLYWSGILRKNFLQPVNGSNITIVNWIIKLILFTCFSFFKNYLKDFPFCSAILLTPWFIYLQTRIESVGNTFSSYLKT